MIVTVKIAKLNTTRDFDVESLAPTSFAYAVQYGLTQAINDAHASVMRKNFETDSAYFDAVAAKVGKRIEQIESGNVPGSRAPTDPSAAKVRKLVRELGGELSDDELAVMLAAVTKARAKKSA